MFYWDSQQSIEVRELCDAEIAEITGGAAAKLLETTGKGWTVGDFLDSIGFRPK